MKGSFSELSESPCTSLSLPLPRKRRFQKCKRISRRTTQSGARVKSRGNFQKSSPPNRGGGGRSREGTRMELTLAGEACQNKLRKDLSMTINLNRRATGSRYHRSSAKSAHSRCCNAPVHTTLARGSAMISLIYSQSY